MNGLFSLKFFSKSLFLLLICSRLFAQEFTSLPRSIPEAEGISSDAIISFLDAVSESKHELHSFMILRHGKVVAEGWWNPYRPGLKHTMYSVSKSFTATAVGFAAAENKLSVDDKVVSFFPDFLPDSISKNLSQLRIKDLLNMSVGHASDPTNQIRNSDDWIRLFLNFPVEYEPGSRFLYNSVGTFMLSAIVQKVTGTKIIDFLKPRLFDPLGIYGIDWENSPDGITTGGWGLRLKTEDMAKFGLLFLQKGKWNGSQLINESWINEAVTKKIDQDPNAPQSKKDSSDWLQGYCYQMWRCRHNSFRADGAFGQFIVMLPEQDAVIVITSESTDLQGELNLVWDYLLPAFNPGALPENPEAYERLKKLTASLMLPVPPASRNSLVEEKISGKYFDCGPNDKGLKSVAFNFDNNVCSVTLVSDSAFYNFNFGSGKWILGETERPGPYIAGLAKGNRAGLAPYKTAGSFSWVNNNTLELTLRYIESPHKEVITIVFDKEEMSMEIADIFSRTEMKAKAHLKATANWD